MQDPSFGGGSQDFSIVPLSISGRLENGINPFQLGFVSH
jgi:hypothetical protein